MRGRVVLLVLTALAVGVFSIRRTSDDDYHQAPDEYNDHGMDPEPSDQQTDPNYQPSGNEDSKSDSGKSNPEDGPRQSLMAAFAPVLAIMVASKSVPALDVNGSMFPTIITVFFYPRAVAAVAQSFQINLQSLPDSSFAAINSAVAVGVFATVAIVGKSMGHFQPAGQDKIGTKATSVADLEYVQGASVDVSRKGSVKVIEFWASWCGPCKAVIPHLNELWKKLVQEQGAEKVQIVGVNQGEDKVKVNEFIKEMAGKMDYPVALDTQGSLKDAYPNSGIPHAYVVDTQGVICWSGHPGSAEMPAAIRNALRGNPGQNATAKVEKVN